MEKAESGRFRALVGVALAKGVLGRDFQILARKACERGYVQDVLEATAHVLLMRGVADGVIPPAVGEKLDPLLVSAENSIRDVVRDYHQRGGVLTAKGHASPLGLQAGDVLWIEDFAKPLEPAPSLDDGLTEEGIQQRLTVSAQEILRVLMRAAGLDEDQMAAVLGNPTAEKVVLEGIDVESFCKKAALAVYRVFREPEKVLHERAHGKETL